MLLKLAVELFISKHFERRRREKCWTGQAEKPVLQACQLTNIKQSKESESTKTYSDISLRPSRKLGEELSKMISRQSACFVLFVCCCCCCFGGVVVGVDFVVFCFVFPLFLRSSFAFKKTENRVSFV